MLCSSQEGLELPRTCECWDGREAEGRIVGQEMFKSNLMKVSFSIVP